MSVAVGIDLGTTNSVAAVAGADGVSITTGDNGERIHPSIVAFPEQGGVVVGSEARQRRALDPVHTIYSAKRLIGQNMRAPLVQLALTALPYEVEEGQNQQPIITARGRRMTVPEVSALVLGHLKTLTEQQVGDAVEQAVITVPANFSDAQRQATREAGLIAGLEVLRLVNEPTAAALAYGYARSLDACVAVFDLGGGTFDVSILRIRDEIFEVMGTGGDYYLGGDDFDRTVAEHLAAEMNRELHIDPRQFPGIMTRLSMAAEEIKCHLSSAGSAEGNIGGLVTDDGGTPLTLPFCITRAQFQQMISGYVDRTIEVCRQVLTATKLEPSAVSEVICVGGCTRIPYVRERVAELFGREPAIDINPDEVVATGAAIQAGILTGMPAGIALAKQGPLDSATTGAVPISQALRAAPPNALLLDVTPATLSIATAGGYIERLLEKNAPIPIERTRQFTTARDNQTRVVVECCRGEGKRFQDNEPLGELTLDNLPAKPRGEVCIEVTFRVDTDGILHVRARDSATGGEQQAQLKVIGAPVKGSDNAAHAPSPAS